MSSLGTYVSSGGLLSRQTVTDAVEPPVAPAHRLNDRWNRSVIPIESVEAEVNPRLDELRRDGYRRHVVEWRRRLAVEEVIETL